MKKIVCITGGMGSGKSTVAGLLLEAGFAVYDSDYRAKELMLREPVRAQIEHLLGLSAYLSNGALNRPFISEQIFMDPGKKSALEAIVHPVVRSDFEQWLEQSEGSMVFKESALTLETGDNSCSIVLLVDCAENIRFQRVKQRNPEWSNEEIQARFDHQLTDAQRKNSDAILIDNSGSLEKLKKSIDQALAKCI
jgi:dephospho-CoA kinase